MNPYQKPYLHLFNSISTAIEQMQQANYGLALTTLMNAQAEAEEAFLNESEDSGE